ncbi:maleylpyruvate isomerase family mycothiol-dependent enzyme [Nocardioides marmotae]|uniref:Maleylpyruvate isomerase family mycothiol-dependent enzyme n=1 Tax=Nocardioides marmotae TaxID=2663857 RepID=A0A6I3JG41_9ACTN|nr:maleylpyruvate isomerase family mycothiol-dependent enzyme [Nocardioides marmotae]MCR6033348.1 maleylpyruvate isomerase family mycothiol-dependent enzyme [Gordonia jinghuaiqii]MBC9734105.1 maleylpyruvate isomerase family mycothiol-dependent enzyme [Nocardioides marmotae]MTB85208.1 maleylpyruvate isomerase family mycothiol-dependent enzyme [Nocardioides marmotae]MTB97005.1 maleylpyruvate isomerase family mycothiol-dependent enzyme [Nocardioides marmotae]QKE00617.1 maleylpyruvate isomerase fa
MDDATAWALLADERRAFADVLERLGPDDWATPSLCAGWTVKDVVAHTMVGPTASIREVMWAMARSRFDFDTANRRLAAARAARTPAELVALVREHADSRFHPPGHDWHAPVTDLLVHRLDCLVPLGVVDPRPAAAWQEALPFLLSRRARHGFIPAGLPELTYVAPDIGWSAGSGERVEAPAEVLALAITRRPARNDELTGPGAAALAEWSRA